MDLAVVPATSGVWLSLEDLFMSTAAAGRCWCVYWQTGRSYRRNSTDMNRAWFKRQLDTGPPPGLVAVTGDLAIGWCQLTPGTALPWLPRVTGRSQRGAGTWAITCMLVRPGFRRRGVTAALVDGAIEYAREAGARALEAYPLDPATTRSASGTGYAPTFSQAGFAVAGWRGTGRPIMRLKLRGPSAPQQ